MYAGKELNRARLEGGYTLRKLAAFAETSSAAISQIETGKRGVSFERLQSLLNLTEHRLVTIPTKAKTPGEVAEFIRDALVAENPVRAYRAFIAYSITLLRLDPVVRLALTLNRPESTGDPVYDAAIAALIQHWLSHDSLPAPTWVHDDSFTLPLPTHIGERVPSCDEVPPAFLEHNVLFPLETLVNPVF